MLAALAALSAGLVGGLPRSSQAGLWSPDTVAAYGLADDLARLEATRERVAHREAERAALTAMVGALGREIGIARRRAEQARARIAAQQDALRAQEQELDRIVPRLLARLRMIEQRRAQAARALADLASLSRRQEIDPELRARMRALGPVLVALLRDRDAAGAALSRQRDRAVDRQRRLAARIPIPQATLAELRDRREEMLGRRRNVLQRLVPLDAELARLSGVGTALARRLMTIEAAHVARAAPGAARPAHDRERLEVAGAAVRGRAARALEVAQASGPILAQASTVAAAARSPATLSARLAPALAVLQPSRSARLLASLHDREGVAGERDSEETRARAPLGPPGAIATLASLSSHVAPARLPAPSPIRPAREVAQAGLDIRGGQTDIMIAAVPGQPVAAPQDGRIVFADAFKSYGLLLIIEHDSEYHTLLWGFSRLRVGVGDHVRGGEIIGVMDAVDGVAPQLGVELRRRGRPVDPLPWLAGSSSKVRG